MKFIDKFIFTLFCYVYGVIFYIFHSKKEVFFFTGGCKLAVNQR